MSNDFPRVSIVIPAYNHADFLDEAIGSVLRQDYPHIELIVLDDGSTDETAGVLENYPCGDFHWETHANMGQARTLNKGWRMSAGAILSYLSADDVLRPGAVSKSVACLQANPDVVLTYCDFELISRSSRTIRRIRPPDFNYRDLVVKGACQPGPAPFFRREAFEATGGWNGSLRQMPDYEYWLRLGLVGRFHRIPKTLGAFRVHDESQTFAAADPEKAEEPVRIMTEYYRRADLPSGLRAAKNQAMSNAYLTSAQLHWRAGRYKAGFRQAAQAFVLHPPNLGAYRTGRVVLNAFLHRLKYFLFAQAPGFVPTKGEVPDTTATASPVPAPHGPSRKAETAEDRVDVG